MEYRYQLAPYSGKASRLVCPNCGQREFVPYVDTETGEILDETCGRCNRESRCGYHLTPAQYFQQHPEARPQGEDWREPQRRPVSHQPVKKALPVKPKATGPVCSLPKEIVEKTIRVEPESNFVKFLDTLFDPIVVEGLVFLYNLGVNKAREVIFYQKDIKGRYRGGKRIQYNPETGKRIKSKNRNPVDWVTQAFKDNGYIPQDWTMTQCLFGEHLLAEYPDRDVCLVEAEKTAVICSGFMPECIWLATGGKDQLGDKLDILRGRQVLAFPDIDAYDKWKTYFDGRDDLSVNVSDLLEVNGSDEDREEQIDIADLLIRWRADGVPPVPSVPSQGGTERPASSFLSDNPVVREIAKYFSPEVMPEVAALVEELDLVPVSITRIADDDG